MSSNQPSIPFPGPDSSAAISFSRAELFEQAGLAALGLLDRDEHEAYEKSLREQPADVREQVLREQARFAQSDELLARVEPDASLKDRVLDRVHAAIVQRVIHAEAMENGAAPQRNGWRITSVALLAACVALGAIAFQTYQTNSSMRSQLESNAVATGSVSVEEMLFDASVSRVALVAGAGNETTTAQATLFVKEAAGEARLVYRGLPRVEGSTYRVVLLDEAGSVTRELAQFDGTAQRDSIKMPAPLARSRVAIVLMPNGEVSAGSKPQTLLAATV
jgi:anti-sigma-K factor RskA